MCRMFYDRHFLQLVNYSEVRYIYKYKEEKNTYTQKKRRVPKQYPQKHYLNVRNRVPLGVLFRCPRVIQGYCFITVSHKAPLGVLFWHPFSECRRLITFSLHATDLTNIDQDRGYLTTDFMSKQELAPLLVLSLNTCWSSLEIISGKCDKVIKKSKSKMHFTLHFFSSKLGISRLPKTILVHHETHFSCLALSINDMTN